jgi:tRNA pseudouridine32 synthase/23S rRNA pseudouridine746 synthase
MTQPMNLEDLILFVDGEAIVIDKPAGLPVDAPRAGGDSVEARIAELSLGFKRPPVPMHRLDRDTSGCLLFARNPKARARFQQAFEKAEVAKSYLAVVDGETPGDEGLIELAVAKVSSAAGGWRMVADEAGKSAATRWKRLGRAWSSSGHYPAEPIRSVSMRRAGWAQRLSGIRFTACPTMPTWAT